MLDPLSLEENIIEELEDKARRSSNLIFYNLDEPEGDNCVDANLVKDIIRKIQPDKALSIRIMGRRRQGHSRPLRDSLPIK